MSGSGVRGRGDFLGFYKLDSDARRAKAVDLQARAVEVFGRTRA